MNAVAEISDRMFDFLRMQFTVWEMNAASYVLPSLHQ